jgi:exodeoxyribonuclease VII small subunit
MAKQTFEQALDALEKCVKALESGDLPLEKAFKRFEEGMALSRQCQRLLDETEKKVSILVRQGEKWDQEKAFPEIDTDGSEA